MRSVLVLLRSVLTLGCLLDCYFLAGPFVGSTAIRVLIYSDPRYHSTDSTGIRVDLYTSFLDWRVSSRSRSQVVVLQFANCIFRTRLLGSFCSDPYFWTGFLGIPFKLEGIGTCWLI